MKFTLAALSLCALCLAPVFAQKKGAKAAGMTDQQFVDFAAQTDMTEANLGQLAANQAGAQGVKDYAQMLVSDHTADYTQLTAVGGKANLVVPKGLDAAHNKMIAPFEKLKGAAFDHKYISTMIEGHTAALAKFKWEAENAQSPDLKAYASADVPTLEKHLQGAKDLAKAKPSGKKM
jgi:putative membrane protein